MPMILKDTTFPQSKLWAPGYIFLPDLDPYLPSKNDLTQFPGG